MNLVCLNKLLCNQVILSLLSNKRTNCSVQKTRGEVSFSNVKPWSQKGTGKARAGTKSSPLWRKGGRCFPGRKIENYNKKINKKMYRKALYDIINCLFLKNKVFLLDNFNLVKPCTKVLFNKIFTTFKQPIKVGLFNSDVNINFLLSIRNIPNCTVLSIYNLDVLDLLKCDVFILFKKDLHLFSMFLNDLF